MKELKAQCKDVCMLTDVTLYNSLTKEKRKIGTQTHGWVNTGVWKYNNMRYDSVQNGEDTVYFNKLVNRFGGIAKVKNKHKLFTYCWHGNNTVTWEHWYFLFASKDGQTV